MEYLVLESSVFTDCAVKLPKPLPRPRQPSSSPSLCRGAPALARALRHVRSLSSNYTGTVSPASHSRAGNNQPLPPNPPGVGRGCTPTTVAPRIGYRPNTSRSEDTNRSGSRVERNTYRKGSCSRRRCTSARVSGTRKVSTTEVERKMRLVRRRTPIFLLDHDDDDDDERKHLTRRRGHSARRCPARTAGGGEMPLALNIKSKVSSYGQILNTHNNMPVVPNMLCRHSSSK